jgi:hypothetical protein
MLDIIDPSPHALAFRRKAASARMAAQAHPSLADKLLKLANSYDELAQQADLAGRHAPPSRRNAPIKT